MLQQLAYILIDILNDIMLPLLITVGTISFIYCAVMVVKNFQKNKVPKKEFIKTFFKDTIFIFILVFIFILILYIVLQLLSNQIN